MAFGKCPTCDLLRVELTEWKQRHDALLEKYHALRQSGHEPTKPIRVIPPKPDSGMQAIRAGERAFTDPRVAAAFQHLIAEGVGEADALREAVRLVDVGVGRREPAPAGTALPDLIGGG